MEEFIIQFRDRGKYYKAINFGNCVYVRKKWGHPWQIYVQGIVSSMGKFKQSLDAAQAWMITKK